MIKTTKNPLRFAGESVVSITFRDRSNAKSAVVILGARIDSALTNAEQTVRVGMPANPNAYLPGTQAPVIGETWNPSIDHTTFAKTAVTDFMLISGSAGSNWSYPGIQGSLLISAPILATVMAPRAGQPFRLPIPDQRSILGAKLYTQGGSIDSSSEVHLANAIDIVIGDYGR